MTGKTFKRRLSLLLAGVLMALTILPGCGKASDDNGGGGGSASVEAVRTVHPERAKFPLEADYFDGSGNFDYDKFDAAYQKWREEQLSLGEAAEPYEDGLFDFTSAISAKILCTEERKNIVYSPLNIYLAMCLLAETTDGGTRQQILDLMGVDDIETLRASADALWNANYCESDDITSLLSNSVWLANDFESRDDVIKLLAEKYHADIFSGEMGSSDVNEAIGKWLDEATGDMLKDITGGIELDPRTRMVLISSILYKARWTDEFNAESTSEGTFHSPDGDITVDMMHAERVGEYFYGDGFAAVRLSLYNGGYMWIVLPDEGTDVYDLPGYSVIRGMVADKGGADSKYLRISMSIPKMDIMSDLDLVSTLKSLGITDAFDVENADFSAVTDEQIWLDSVKHAARFKMDEEGVSAAAFTMMMAAGAGAPPEEKVDFTVDRPYFFVLTGNSGSILFEGIVNDPTGGN